MDRFYLSNELPSTYRNLMDKLNKDEINKEIIKPLMESLKQLPLTQKSKYTNLSFSHSELQSVLCLYMDILFLNLVHEEETINIEAYKKLWNTVFPKCDTKFSTYPIISDDEIVRVTSLHELIFDSENQLDSLFLNSFLPKYRKELNFAFYGYKLYPSPFYKLRVTSARIYGHLKAAFFESYLDKTATY